MEKNGNTYAPGARVRWTGKGSEKLACAEQTGEVLDANTSTQKLLVKLAGGSRWIPFAELEPAG